MRFRPVLEACYDAEHEKVLDSVLFLLEIVFILTIESTVFSHNRPLFIFTEQQMFLIAGNLAQI